MARPALMKGNEAAAEAALRAGCRFYAGYPITPQTELLEYMATNLPRVGGRFIQSESELAAISMVYGASAAGLRAMTSSSSTGVSLMQEGLSYLASAELPAVIVNVSRGGPGLGRICPSQADYFQATKGGGHGDYHLIVLAPASVQEMADLVFLAFDLADRYRNPVMILADGMLGQMMESVVLQEPVESVPARPWAVRGRGDGARNIVISAPYTDADLRAMNLRLKDKYRRLAEAESRHELHGAEEVEHLVVAFGTAARFAMEAVDSLRADGLKAGLLRPVTLFPFPYDAFKKPARSLKSVLVVEMNEGQMIEDVKLGLCAAGFRGRVGSFGGGGGFIPSPADIEREVLRVAGMKVVA